MAELAAVGVASSVLQIVDFGARVVKTAHKLALASNDALREDIELGRLMREQDNITEVLRTSLKPRLTLSTNEEVVVRLSNDCKRQITELLELLDQLKVATGAQGIGRAIGIAKVAVKATRKREEIANRRTELQLMNGQLATALLLLSRDQSVDSDGKIVEIQHALDVVTAVQQGNDELKRSFAKHEERWKLISTLHFPDMQSRQDSISDAFPQTYGWALGDDASGLRTWLRTGSGTYWVSGKAGSGKSTLMKFLGNDQRTLTYLHEWCEGHQNLLLVKCYFWYLGSAMQRSIEGLLRTILYQLLTSCPEVVETLLPERLARTRDTPRLAQDSWSSKELLDVLQKALGAISRAKATTTGTTTLKCCMFIDGLDEYDGYHGGLVRTLETLASGLNTKLCVSSRPWNVFSGAYETRSPHLSLQDLTVNDIKFYVESNLTRAVSPSDASGNNLSRDNDITITVNAVVKRAEGVFLWVFLVVQSLLRGLDERDTIVTLLKRVLAFPSNLEKFFDTIISRVDVVYREHMVQALVLAYLCVEGHEAAAEHSSYLDFELIRRGPTGLRDPQYIWDLEPQVTSLDDCLDMIKATKTFLAASCKDLFTVTVPPDVRESPSGLSRVKVQFLHRAVFDYLKTTSQMQKLLWEAPPCFRDKSVFHILNMGKSKLFLSRDWEKGREDFSRHITFSLGRTWSGLDFAFIDQMQACHSFYRRDFRRTDPCVLLGAAHIAFEQFDTFKTLYEYLNIQRNYSDCTAKPEEFHVLLAAALGVADLRSFPSRSIDIPTLALVLSASTGVIMPEYYSAETQIILRFLQSALPPLTQASVEASTGLESWKKVFASSGMQHMYNVCQLLKRSGRRGAKDLFDGPCPVSDDAANAPVWQFLTTSKPSRLEGDVQAGSVRITKVSSRRPRASDKRSRASSRALSRDQVWTTQCIEKANMIELQQFAAQMDSLTGAKQF